MNLITPPKLKIGDTIGLVSPSAGLAKIFPHRIKQAKKELEKLGLKVIFSKHALDCESWVSSTAQNRAADIHDLWQNKKVKAIMAIIGGNHSNQLLKYLDFKMLKKNPKMFIGYSDNTILHWAIASQSNLQTYYGPCAMVEFGEFPETLPYTIEYFKKACFENYDIEKIQASKTWTDEFLDWGTQADSTRPRELFPSKGYLWWKEGEAQAPIFGGAIPSINYLAGSKYWINLKGKILFIDIPEGFSPGEKFSLSWLDAFLANLDLLNIFSSIKGLVIGRAYQYRDEDIKQLKNVILRYCEHYDYPILYNANIGHSSPVITIPLGATSALSSDKNSFKIFG